MPEKTRRPKDPRKATDKSGDVDRQKLEDNQRQLKVGTDHKTSAMKKGHRGTYP